MPRPTREQRLAEILPAHPAIVQFDQQVLPYGSIPKEGQGCGVPVPWYCAGFFLHPTWANSFTNERDIEQNLDEYIRQLPGGQAVDDSLGVVYYYDKDDCAFLSMHDNIDDGVVATEDWMGRRDEQIDLVCKLLEFTEAQIKMAKSNFAWHLMRPHVYDRVPLNFTVHIPDKVEEYRFYARP